MKSIITKFHGPTNTRGSRISATDDEGRNRITISVDHALSQDDRHDAAAKALCVKMGWTDHPLMRGGNGNTGNVYVFDSQYNRVTFTAEEIEVGKRKGVTA